MSKQKGNRRERQARELYERAGYECQAFRGTAYRETDGFGLYDFVAVRDDSRVAFVQVKSNSTEGALGEFFQRSTAALPREHAVSQFLVCHDYQGWRLAEPAEHGYEWVYDGRDADGAMGEGLVEVLNDAPE